VHTAATWVSYPGIMQHPTAFERDPVSSSRRQPYFAYGLNMDEIQLAGRFPGHYLEVLEACRMTGGSSS
jgi:hypothetical protein